MAQSFSLEVITPDRTVLRTQVLSVQVPMEEGSIGILARHAPLVATVGDGVLEAVGQDGEKHVLHVGDGFVEVTAEGVKVLAAVGETSSRIDVQRAERAVQRAREKLSHRSDPNVDAARAEAALRRALMRLKAAKYTK